MKNLLITFGLGFNCYNRQFLISSIEKVVLLCYVYIYFCIKMNKLVIV